MLLEGLEAGGVVDVGIDRAVRLAGVPLVADLGGPGPGRLLAVRVRHDRIEEHQVAVSAEGVGRACGVHGLDPLRRVAFVHDARPHREVCVLSRAPLEAFVDEALSRQVVDLQKRRRRAVHAAMLADGVGHAVTLRVGDMRVRHVVHLLIDGLDSIEGSENFLGLLGSPAVGKRPKENGLLTGYGGVHEETSDIVGHVDGSCVVPMKLVEGIEDRLQFIATPDVVVVMPGVRAPGKDVHLVARDDAEIMTGPFHTPEKVAVARCVDADGGAIGQDNVELQHIVANQAVQTFLPTVATPKTGADHADALTPASGGDKALVPKILNDWAHEGAASEPG